MPNFPIIDTHVHLWDPNTINYPWLANVPHLNKPFELEEFKSATATIAVEKMVFIQCECHPEQAEDEAAWVTQLAQKDARIQGIVAQAPLELGEGARPVLNRYAKNKLIKGVRRLIQSEDDINFCIQPDFVKGVQLLSDYDFSFDICILHTQLESTIKLVAQCPNTQFILDHIGKPDIKSQLFEPWKENIIKLAQFPNVYCKISGLVTEAAVDSWTKEDLKPYIDHVVNSFGKDRIVFGGDWPVIIEAATYTQWIETLDWALNTFSESDLQKIYRKNAIAFYKL